MSREGITIDTLKIEAVQNWPRLTSQPDIRSFLDLAGYYNRFGKGFSSISSPFINLTKKTVNFLLSKLSPIAFSPFDSFSLFPLSNDEFFFLFLSLDKRVASGSRLLAICFVLTQIRFRFRFFCNYIYLVVLMEKQAVVFISHIQFYSS